MQGKVTANQLHALQLSECRFIYYTHHDIIIIAHSLSCISLLFRIVTAKIHSKADYCEIRHVSITKLML
jgi:hypothetical protein